MNIPEAKTINRVNRLLDKVLEGKTEYLKELKEAKRLIDNLIEFKAIRNGLPCMYRYEGICTKTESVWYGNHVNNNRCSKCKHYEV